MTTTPSGIFRAVDAGTRAVLQVVVGLAFFLVGGAMAVYLIEVGSRHPPIQKGLIYLCAGASLFGALLLPGILTPATAAAKQVVVIVNQLPTTVTGLFGGRRSTDQPPKP